MPQLYPTRLDNGCPTLEKKLLEHMFTLSARN